MVHTQSATPLDAVKVVSRGAVSDVWLRRNIATTEIDLDDGLSQTMWEADEVHGTLDGTPSAEYVQARFAQLWAAFEEADLTDRELIELRSGDLSTGIVEVADLAAANEVAIEDIAQGLLEIAEIVGGGE